MQEIQTHKINKLILMILDTAEICIKHEISLVFIWFGFVFGLSAEHTHVVCVVRKEAEANETPGATNMEVQRNVGFSSSSWE